MATKRFDSRLHILVTKEEQTMLEELGDHEGLRPSDVVRQLIRRKHAEVFGAREPARTAIKGAETLGMLRPRAKKRRK